jgi:hypothetical protein
MEATRWHPARLRPLALAIAALVTIGATRAHAGDGAQFSRDCDRVYVNKQVADEQWAITWQRFGDASGNVFKLDGSPPSFIDCRFIDGNDQRYTYDCYGAPACNGAPAICGGTQWVLVVDDLVIDTAFFLPPGVDPADPYATCQIG